MRKWIFLFIIIFCGCSEEVSCKVWGVCGVEELDLPECRDQIDEPECVDGGVETCIDESWSIIECKSRNLKCAVLDEFDGAACESGDRIDPDSAKCQIQDIFSIPAVDQYNPFSYRDVVINSEDFGVYRDEFDGNRLSKNGTGMVEWNKDGDIIEVVFEYQVITWLSFRYQFVQSPISAAGCEGIEFDIFVDEIQNNNEYAGVYFRFTIADLEHFDDFFSDEHLRDELWWWDDEVGILNKKSDEWVHIKIPFGYFYESYGRGTRHNNSELNLSYMVAVEFNILGYDALGQFRIKELKTY